MRIPWHSMRLSTRLLLVVLTCLLPVILLGVWVEYSHWQERRAQLGDLSLQQAQLLNGDVDSIAEGARTLLSTVAQLHDVRDAAPTCGERLRATQRTVPMFAFVALLDADGNLICASEPALRLTDGDRPQWVRDAIAATGFAAGRFATTPGVSDGFLPFALPLDRCLSGSRRRSGRRPGSRAPVGTPVSAAADRIAIPCRQRAHRCPIATASFWRAARSMRRSSASASRRRRWPW